MFPFSYELWKKKKKKKKNSRLPITGIFKENQYFDNSSLSAFFSTCHALKTWFELSKVKLVEMMWRETKITSC